MFTADKTFGCFSEFLRLKWSTEDYMSFTSAKSTVVSTVCLKQYMDIDLHAHRPHLNIYSVIIKTYEPQTELTFESTGQ